MVEIDKVASSPSSSSGAKDAATAALTVSAASMSQTESLNSLQGTNAGLPSANASTCLVTCPQCSKPYQILNPQEGLVYQCQSCQTQFLVKKESNGRHHALKWSEEQIFKILFEIPGETAQSQSSRAWRNVFENLQDLKLHEQFVSICRQKNSLNIAREKYKQLAVYLNWDLLPEHLKIILEPELKKVSPWAERMPWMIFGVAVLLMLLGSVLPGHRNMIGAGVLVCIIDFLVYRNRIKLLF